jgi:predicted phage-related endonuclease
LQRDPEIAAAIVEVAEDFWTGHVAADVPPPVDGSDEWARFLAGRAQRSDALIDATPELDRWAEQLREARDAMEAAEALEKEARNHLIAAIGEAAGVKGSTWRATYKAAKPTKRLDLESLVPTLEAQILKMDPALAPFLPALRERFTVEKPGSRRFLPTFTTKETA